MSRTVKIFTLLLALMFAFSLLVVTALADDQAPATCETKTKNVAPLAKATTTATQWFVTDDPDAINDGHVTTFSPSVSQLRGDQFRRYLTFDQIYDFSRIVITTGGVVARFETSKVITDAIAGKYIEWDFTIYLYNELDMIVYEQVFTTEEDGTTEINFTDFPKSAYKLELKHNDCGSYDRYNQAVYEIEMYATVGHEWETVEVTRNPTCTVVGTRTAKCSKCAATKSCIVPANGHTANPDNPCDAKCIVCNVDNTVTKKHNYSDNCTDLTCNTAGCTGTRQEWELPHAWASDTATECSECDLTRCIHEYDNDCDRICNKCNEKKYDRDPAGVVPDVWHLLDDTCTDTVCNHCEEIVEPPHVYKLVCSLECSECDHVRTLDESAHTWGPIFDDENDVYIDKTNALCDTECNVCHASRLAPHSYEYPCALFCQLCEAPNKNILAAHVFDNSCDPDCNEEKCRFVRVTSHQYDNACDAICNVCEATRTKDTDANFDPDHDYDNACDANCNICGAERTVSAHVYDNACDTTCNICNAPRTVADHVYDNACDTTCNVCSAERTVPAHAYDNDCDATCNACGAERTVPEHQYGLWITITEPERKTEGTQIRNCIVCNDQQTQQIPALGGMSGGAIAGIATGSVAVAGAGGFSLFWFVIKKKSWADLLMVFKK